MMKNIRRRISRYSWSLINRLIQRYCLSMDSRPDHPPADSCNLTHLIRDPSSPHYGLMSFLDGSGINDSCRPIQEVYPDIVDLAGVRILFGLLYSVVMAVSFAGNSVVFYSICCKKLSFTVRKVFVLSLACSDILISLFSLPATALSIFTREWILGGLACMSIGFIQGTCIFVSSFTLALIAIDRFQLIVHPTSNVQITFASGYMIMGLIWLSGLVLSCPLIFYSSVTHYPWLDVCGGFCEETWPSEGARKVYGVLVLVVQYGLPLCITLVCYLSIACQVSHQIRRRYQHQLILPEAEKKLMQRRRCTNRMTTLMVASFMFAWIPLNLLNLIRDFGMGNYIREEHFQILYACGHLFAMTSTVWNPIIYSWFQAPFRALIPCTGCVNDATGRGGPGSV